MYGRRGIFQPLFHWTGREGRPGFGEQRLLEALLRHRELPSQTLLEAIVAEVRQFSPYEQGDDLTVIVAKCWGN